MQETQQAEVMEISLEMTIQTKLIQSNVTKQVLAALKEKYAGLKLTALDDKESYLEIKAAAKECAKLRTLTVKICKEGRERAVKEQKLWVAKEKEVVGEISEVENALDAETDKFESELERKATEEKKRQEDAYINRQAVLTKMGATYVDGSFILGSTSFEANLVKESSQDVWEEAIVPKFQAEYEKVESVRIEEERKKREEDDRIKAEQEKLRQEQEAFRLQQEEFKKQQEESTRKENERIAKEKSIKLEADNKRWRERLSELIEVIWNGQEVIDKFYDTKVVVTYDQLLSLSDLEWNKIRDEHNSFSKERLAMQDQERQIKKQEEIENAKQQAIKEEQERQAEQKRQDELKKRQEEEKKKADMEAAGDKTKWEEFIKEMKKIPVFEMRSGQYRKKMAIAKEKIEEIQSL